MKAVQRHVDVRLLLPGKHNDQPLTKSAGRTAYGRMLAGGVKIFEYQPTMIHEKTLVVDGMFSMFGSSNLDARSSEINEELDVAVYDREFGREMESVFENDLRQSREYTLCRIQTAFAVGTNDGMADASVSFAAITPKRVEFFLSIFDRSFPRVHWSVIREFMSLRMNTHR